MHKFYKLSIWNNETDCVPCWQFLPRFGGTRKITDRSLQITKTLTRQRTKWMTPNENRAKIGFSLDTSLANSWIVGKKGGTKNHRIGALFRGGKFHRTSRTVRRQSASAQRRMGSGERYRSPCLGIVSAGLCQFHVSRAFNEFRNNSKIDFRPAVNWFHSRGARSAFG